MREEPFFSIVIPTHNRPVQLEECLHSISRLDYPSDRFEFVVVDDQSEITPTAAIRVEGREASLSADRLIAFVADRERRRLLYRQVGGRLKACTILCSRLIRSIGNKYIE